jgi:hypothetical protein
MDAMRLPQMTVPPCAVNQLGEEGGSPLAQESHEDQLGRGM